MASPQESANKEVKVDFDVVRMKVSAARSKIVSVVITTLISGLLVAIPVPANAAPLSSPNCTLGVGLGGTPGVSTNQAGHGWPRALINPLVTFYLVSLGWSWRLQVRPI